jgi:hypothetical protein
MLPRNQKRRHGITVPPVPTAIDESIVQYHKDRLGRLHVVKTTRTPSGQILDWIPVESQCPQGRVATPPPSEGHPTLVAGATSMAAIFETQAPCVERGPVGTVPLLRRRFHFADKLSSPRHKRKMVRQRLRFGDGPLRGGQPNDSPADPAGFYRCGGSQAVSPCYGCESILSVWDPWCENWDDHSISQIALQNFENAQPPQSLEAGWDTCEQLFGDELLHLFTYYTTNGYDGDGNNVGGYNALYTGWVQIDPNVFPGSVINAVDFFGFPAYELKIKYQLWEGNWWFQAQDIWIGYYPAALFGAQPGANLSDHAQTFDAFGEVYSSLPDPSQTTTSMGSGMRGSYGWPWAAYQRDMLFQTATGVMEHSNMSADAETPVLYDVSVSPLFPNYFFFGGSGIGSPHIVVYPEP